MIIRIVRMTFRKDTVEDFLQIFEQSKENIRSFPGCLHLQLLEDVNTPNTFSTYSIWNDENSLNLYRESNLFGSVWPETKRLFATKPSAHSYEQKIKLD